MENIPPGVDLCQIPAGIPPSGVPEFSNPPSLAPALIGVTATMVAWSIIFLSGRLWVNRRRLQVADTCAILAFVICVGYSGNILAMTKYMRHQYDIPACWFNATYVKLICSMQILMPLSHSLSKASVLLLFFQIFSVSKRMRIAIYVGLILIILGYGPNLILGPVYTVPRAGETWETLLINGRPQHLNIVGMEQAVLAVIIDIYIFILPFPMLSTLNLGSRKRLHLVFVFGFALTGVIASVVGLVVRIPLLSTQNPTWIQSQIFICIMVEIYVAIIVSCLPAFANFTKAHVSQLSFYKSLTSLLRSRQTEGESGPTPLESWRLRTTFGGTKPPGAAKKKQKNSREYYEFHDMTELNNGWTPDVTNEANVFVSDDTESQRPEKVEGITRTRHVDQSSVHRGTDLISRTRVQDGQEIV